MCAPDPNAGIRRQARERNKARTAEFYGDSIKQWNRESDFKDNLKNIRGLGRSRVLSDFQEFATRARGKSLLGKENAAREMFQKQTVSEGGRSRTRGRGRTMEYFSKIADIDRKQFALATVGEAKMQQGLQLRQQAMEKEQRSKLGLGPQFGMPTMLPPKDTAGQFMNSLSFGMNMMSGIMSFSDKRLKDDITKVGVSPKGYDIYEWTYRARPNERWRGVIAQEIVKKNPMAVGVLPSGFLGVYYDMLDVDLEAA